ncbi:Metal-sulfur cluster biosynthetic enzyme [Thalassobacillus cyri]|uniref:Metal-sulfur cluster biosynthetic enzyme n=1 Tax=Thalassobacillus cyri TaxID=571932 RepID=A0A1H3VIR3_9BACI|nr:metal-sulfur cluster assembly factor [Thalassobacillus cyri]SDZ74561.1 Metal-sulfur cluster biosynthetic enzyme [Thalassobacillus cyri]
MDLTKQVEEALYQVIDPELGINIVDLGLVYKIDVNETNDVHVQMTLTTPGCPLHDSIVSGAEAMIYGVDEVNDVHVELVWHPAWSPEKMSSRAKEMLM